ncbi:MAG: nucleotidyltransferase family protein [Oscillospiraceae bacterium]|nr:nucleotidyltransferase family protein [Oscillospiraceae bacterium]
MTQHTYSGINAEHAALIELLAQQVFGAAAPAALPDDTGFVLREAEQQSVFPLIFPAAAALAPRACEAWRLRNLRHISHNYNIINAHYEAHTLLTAAKIRYTVIKGCASSFYYPAPELRTMGDVDLYVARRDMDRARAAFEAAGYSVSGLDHPHHWTFERDGVELELHWVPSGIPAADDGSILAMFDDLLDRGAVKTVAGQEMVLPDPFHHGLILLLHTANHMTAGGVGLRHLLDWLVFVNSMDEQSFRTLLEPSLRRIGLWHFACALSAVGTQYFGCAPRSFCETVSPELALGLLRDIFDGGNFGAKNADRLNQSKLLRDNESRQIRGGGELGHALRFLNQRARSQYPPSVKHPVLLPIGWAKVLRKRRRDIRAGKQTRSGIHSTLRGAREREALYVQLRLFEE